MKMKRILLALVTVIVLVGVSGCNLSKSGAPPATPTAGGAAKPTNQSMGIIPLIATQTAAALAAQQTLGAPNVPNVVTLEPGATVDNSTNPVVVTSTPAPAATAAPVVVAAATAGRPATYTLQKGEFPFCIARRFNVNPNDLLAVNGLGLNSATFPGMQLRIPQSGSFPGSRSLHSHPASYMGIQTMRLSYYEFFSKFFSGGGVKYEPLTLNAGKLQEE